jgi:HEXXH motif-containing protein
LPVFSGGETLAGELQVEILDGVVAHNYEQAGVKFYPARELVAVNVLGYLKGAINVLKLVPSLLTTVAVLVRAIHVIDPGDDDYDISFSEPHIPFSIFVSVPRGSDITNPLRVAEAIVHEAMHLQLTLIERVTPLVVESDSKYLSPWRQELRMAGGVLHGLYVFKVIDAYLTKLLACESLVEGSIDYMRDRREQIARQVGEIKPFQESPDLTSLGTAFVTRLLN